jgi:hypothetical protein
MAALISILREEEQQALQRHAMRGSVKQKTKNKRQQRAQSRLALARFRQQQREQRQQTAARRAEQRWNKTLRHLAALGATVEQHEEAGDDKVVLTQKKVEGKLEEVNPTQRGKRPCKRHSELLQENLR